MELADDKPFIFKQFVIHQEKCAMKVGTDSLLLGAWTTVTAPQKILDVGTGTGILSLMMAQKYPSAQIDAVEIDENAYQQATENVRQSKFKNQIRVYHCAFQAFECRETYDLIITNPPYFRHSLQPKNRQRGLARHIDHLPFEDILQKAFQLLSEEGVLSLILPTESSTVFTTLAQLRKLYCFQRCNIRTVRSKPPKRCLLAFSKKLRPFFQEELLLQETHQHYTEDYKRMMREFLTIFS